MHAGAISLSDVGMRLRHERERRDLNQSEFGELGGINRNTQAMYESGKRPFDANYLLNLISHDVDVPFILTGRRAVGTLNEDQSRLLTAYDALHATDRNAVIRLACAAAGIPSPALRIDLPSPEALEDAMSSLLEEAVDWSPAEFVHELAISLPTLIHAAADEVADHPLDHSDNLPDSPARSRAVATSTRRARSI